MRNRGEENDAWGPQENLTSLKRLEIAVTVVGEHEWEVKGNMVTNLDRMACKHGPRESEELGITRPLILAPSVECLLLGLFHHWRRDTRNGRAG